MRLISFFCALFLFYTVSAQQAFRASWIAASSHTDSNSWQCFRKNFALNTVPKNLVARIAVDTKYWLWINGKLVVYEGGLKRGPNPRDTYFDEVSIAPYLQKGNNLIAILVWFWGGEGFSHNNSGQSALMFDCRNEAIDLSSNKTWKALNYAAYQASTAPKPNFRLSEPNIAFDAQKELPGWNDFSFNDKPWKNGIELGKAGIAPWNALVRRPIPLFKFGELTDYMKTEKHGDTIVCTLPYDGQFSPYLKIRTSKGQRIFISSDSYFLGGSPGDSLYTICAEYFSKEGLQEYESLGWISGHEIRYVLPRDAEVISLKYRESSYASEFAGSFECSDTTLNKLWEKSRRSLFVNMRDSYMDCPDRERAQWAGDAAMEMAQAFYSLDRQSDALSKKLFLDLLNWQRTDSVIYNPVPETGWKKELPAHSLMPLSEAWRYYQYTKDTSTLRLLYPAIKKYLALWKMGSNGQLVYREGGWNWGDWGEHIDFVLIQHGCYLLTMQAAMKISNLLGMREDSVAYAAKIGLLKTFLNSPDCWNSKAYRHKDYKKETDERVNALMLIAGVADPAKYPALTEVFTHEEHASPWMEKFVLESLIRMGKPDLALKRMKHRFGKMVDSPLSTLWESWNYSPGVGWSYNHGWSGGPLVLLSQYFAGISPDEYSKHQYIIRPILAGLSWINASIETGKGLLSVAIKDNRAGIEVSCSVPAGLTVDLAIPKKGRVVQKVVQGEKKTLVPIVREDQDYLWVVVTAGSHKFSAE